MQNKNILDPVKKRNKKKIYRHTHTLLSRRGEERIVVNGNERNEDDRGLSWPYKYMDYVCIFVPFFFSIAISFSRRRPRRLTHSFSFSMCVCMCGVCRAIFRSGNPKKRKKKNFFLSLVVHSSHLSQSILSNIKTHTHWASISFH